MRAGSRVLLLLTLMFLGSLGLWVVMPVFWLWVGGRVDGATQSLGAAVGVVLGGVVVSIALAVPLLSWLNRKGAQAREARGLPERARTPLESVLPVSATLA